MATWSERRCQVVSGFAGCLVLNEAMMLFQRWLGLRKSKVALARKLLLCLVAKWSASSAWKMCCALSASSITTRSTTRPRCLFIRLSSIACATLSLIPLTRTSTSRCSSSKCHRLRPPASSSRHCQHQQPGNISLTRRKRSSSREPRVTLR